MTPISQGVVRLEARGVGFGYSKPVLEDISLRLTAGTLSGLIGPNGSGKTTVLRLLAGILLPSRGEVLFREAIPLEGRKRKEIARHIAVVPQNGGPYEYETVFRFAMQGRSPHLSLLGFESDRDEEIVRQVLEMTRLTPLLSVPVSEISGGEKQRLLLARALAQQAEVLLLDEFTANLDINYQVELMRLVRRATRQKNLASLVVSHEINLLSGFCDWIILLADGRIRRQGTPAEVLTRENLQGLFGMDFVVRPLPSGFPEVLPVMHEGESP